MKTIEPASEFSWGVVVRDYEVGPYTIREFHPLKREGSRLTDEADFGVRNYHGYIDGKSGSESWETLDEALAGLIVKRSLGPNHRQINCHFIAGVQALAATD